MTLELFSSVSAVETNPGPGQYNSDPYRTIGGPLSLKYSIKANLKSTFQTQDSDTSKVDFMPFRKTSDSLPRYCKIAPRYDQIQTDSHDVGPSYLPDSGFKQTKGFTIKSRYVDHDNTSTPGPGAYFPKDIPRTQFHPMGSRPPIVLAEASCSPGPGAYNLSREIGENSFKFTIRPITAATDEEGDNPGYKYNNPLHLGDDQPKFSLSRAKQTRHYNNGIPGPGAYYPKDPGTNLQIGRSIHSRIKEPTPNIDDVPYENTRQFPNNKRPATIHRKCGREYFSCDDSIPGPNFFPSSTLDHGRQHFLGKREIPPKKDPAQTPGPCTYNLSNQIRSSMPAFTMKGPLVRDDWLPKGKTAPGPGQYDIKSENTVPKWTIGERSISMARQKALNDEKIQRARTAAALERNKQELGGKKNDRLAKTSLM